MSDQAEGRGNDDVRMQVSVRQWILVGLTAIAVGGVLALQYIGISGYSRPLLMMASSLFVAIPVLGRGYRSGTGRALIAGLVF